MNKTTFDRIVVIATAAASRPTAADQNAGCAPIGKLTAEDKIDALCKFVDRDLALRKRGGSGDWVAWVFASGVIPWRERLPWTRTSVEHVLQGVIVECRVLPPEVTVRAVEQFLDGSGPPDAKLKKLIARAAKSMWPSEDSEGANFKKAAAKLRALAGAK